MSLIVWRLSAAFVLVFELFFEEGDAVLQVEGDPGACSAEAAQEEEVGI